MRVRRVVGGRAERSEPRWQNAGNGVPPSCSRAVWGIASGSTRFTMPT